MELKQDMPPPGGYAPITFKAVPLKGGLNIQVKFALALGIMGAGWYLFDLTKKKQNNERIEMRCGRIALLPMLIAETDRMILKQMRRNRDAEERIMKDVKGWEIGKWKHMPVFLTVDPDEFFKPSPQEYYVHADPKYMRLSTDLLKNN